MVGGGDKRQRPGAAGAGGRPMPCRPTWRARCVTSTIASSTGCCARSPGRRGGAGGRSSASLPWPRRRNRGNRRRRLRRAERTNDRYRFRRVSRGSFAPHTKPASSRGPRPSAASLARTGGKRHRQANGGEGLSGVIGHGPRRRHRRHDWRRQAVARRPQPLRASAGLRTSASAVSPPVDGASHPRQEPVSSADRLRDGWTT